MAQRLFRAYRFGGALFILEVTTLQEIKLYQADCFDVFPAIPDGSVDLVLTDPPYGTMNGEKRSGHLREHNRVDDCRSWDFALDEKSIFQQLCRIVRQNGKIALFSQEPYTSKLILADVPRIQFIQRLAWKKNVAGNFLCSSQNCMQYIEDICLFRKDCNDYSGEHPLRQYFLNEKIKSGLENKQFSQILGNGMASHYFTDKIQFACPTESNYTKLQTTGFFKKSFSEIKEIDKEYKDKYPSVFNLNGQKSKSNVFEYKKDNDGYHPTQKPIALLEDLILTYSNPGDTVLDFTMGSGSTGVACQNTGRKFIGIERDQGCFKIAQNRIDRQGYRHGTQR